MLQVISEKKWSEVCDPFNFSKSFTSKSWTIRRLYCQLLWHYEQVRDSGWGPGVGYATSAGWTGLAWRHL